MIIYHINSTLPMPLEKQRFPKSYYEELYFRPSRDYIKSFTVVVSFILFYFSSGFNLPPKDVIK